MDHDEYGRRLREVILTASVNQSYNQILESRYATIDRCIRVAVLAVSILGVVLAVPQLEYLWSSFAAAVAALFVAAVLNAVPVVDWQKTHDKLFHLWGDLRKEAVAEQLKTCDDGHFAPHHVERLGELIDKMESIHLIDPSPPNKKILNRCQEDEHERVWGPGIRTAKQVEKERARRQGVS